MRKVFILLLILITSVFFTSCTKLPEEISSATETTYIDRTTSSDTQSSLPPQDESTPPAEEPTPSSSKTEPISSTSTSSTSSKPVTTTQLPTTVTTTLGTIPIGTTADVTSPEEYARLVQEATKHGGVYSPYANVGTGISWDGVTPILYTYEDGSTGYELREGAKYEKFPGLIGSVNLSICFCSECGKASGNGTNGTCVQWLMGDLNCPNCGVHVEVRTCHTCGE